ncbi:MAG TPA: glycosyltransferase family 2 protein [Gemmatimonadota bacterium]|nr:glycosyltransferase family 2 protein [Gemmatimonadota bacterium]
MVVPLFNEAPNVPPLVDAVRAALPGDDWELLLVDDGSHDGTAELADEYASSDHRVRVLHLARNFGQTAAMKAGFDHARGDVVITMDGDLQNDPGDIPRLIEELGRGYDLVTGYRENRQDRVITRKIPSWIANRLIRRVTGVRIRDTGCSLRAYRSQILDSMALYSDMHRFIPAIAAATSGARIAEIPVRHHPRRYGISKYGLSRTWRVILDLLTISMIRSFRDQPLRLFGLAALGAFSGGALFAVATVIAITTFVSGDERAFVFPSVMILFLGLAAYLFMLGMIGEVLVRQYWRVRESLPVVREVSP